MNSRSIFVEAVALDHAGLSAEELATACSVHTRWVVERVEGGLLATVTTSAPAGALRFCGEGLRRARRLAALERDFDANPELAALAVDLIEEVDRLRRQLASRR